jgi:hypothetical protein
MIDSIMQWIRGNNNNIAGRDLTIINYNEYPIRFHEKDIKNIIELFFNQIVSINHVINGAQESYTLLYPGIEKKNELNNLSEAYFEHIKKESVNYFSKIDKFLSDPKNEKLRSKYIETSIELNNKIRCNRTSFDYFEKIFDAIYTFIADRNSGIMNFQKEFIWVFLHYMYFNCDLGEKE